jgi:hypothetical protein
MTPGYKTQQKGGNMSSIIDNLKFEVVSRELSEALKEYVVLEKLEIQIFSVHATDFGTEQVKRGKKMEMISYSRQSEIS